MGIQPQASYIAKDGKVFSSKDRYLHYNDSLEFLKKVFIKLIEDEFFINLKFKSKVFKLYRIKPLTNYTWNYKIRGAYITSSIFITISYVDTTVQIWLRKEDTTIKELIATKDLFEIFL